MVTLEPHRMEMQSFPFPKELPEDAAVAKMRLAGICGFDYHLLEGRAHQIPWPIIQGHENVAEIYEIGEKASREMEVRGEPLADGDRVTWLDHVPCGKCWYCRWLANNIRGALCEKGVEYGSSITCKDPPHLFGGFSEYVYLMPGTWVYKIPQDVPDSVAVFTDTLASVNGIDRAMSRLPQAREGFSWGDIAVVQGSGPVGIMALLKFREYGAAKVIVVGGPDHKLKLAEKFGADHTINIFEHTNPEDRIKEVLKLTEGRGADIALEATGVPSAFPEGIEMVRRGGIYIEVGNTGDLGPVLVSPYRICFKDLTIISQFGQSPHQLNRDLQMLTKWWRNKEYPIQELITHRFPLEKTDEGVRAHLAGKTMKAVVEM